MDVPINEVIVDDDQRMLSTLTIKNQTNIEDSQVDEPVESVLTPAAENFRESVYLVYHNGFWEGIGYIDCGVRLFSNRQICFYIGEDVEILHCIMLDGSDPPEEMSQWCSYELHDGWFYVYNTLPSEYIEYLHIIVNFRRLDNVRSE